MYMNNHCKDYVPYDGLSYKTKSRLIRLVYLILNTLLFSDSMYGLMAPLFINDQSKNIAHSLVILTQSEC